MFSTAYIKSEAYFLTEHLSVRNVIR